MSCCNNNNHSSPLPPLSSFKASCKASFIGRCKLSITTGSLSEKNIFTYVHELLVQTKGVPAATTSSSVSAPDTIWNVSIGASELTWTLDKVIPPESSLKEDTFYGHTEDVINSATTLLPDEKKNKCNKVPFSRILFCLIDSENPCVICWILTNSSPSTGGYMHQRDNISSEVTDHDSAAAGSSSHQQQQQQVHTEALVWICLSETDAAKLKGTYKAIRQRRKMGIIEAIKARHQLTEQQQQQLQQQQQHPSELKLHLTEKESLQPQMEKLAIIEKSPKEEVTKRYITAQQKLDEYIINSLRGETGMSVQQQNFNNHKATQRQRREPLLIQQTKSADTNSAKSYKNLQHKSVTSATPLIMNTTSPQTQQIWIPKQYRSESEFDPTKLNQYIKVANAHRSYRASSVRSRSVDAPLNRISSSVIASESYHKLVKASAKVTTAFCAAKNNLNKGMVVITRSDSLNSEGSSVSEESNLNESDLKTFIALRDPPKSALKKRNLKNVKESSSSSTSSSMVSSQNKNVKSVTFSEFATIQMVDV